MDLRGYDIVPRNSIQIRYGPIENFTTELNESLRVPVYSHSVPRFFSLLKDNRPSSSSHDQRRNHILRKPHYQEVQGLFQAPLGGHASFAHHILENGITDIIGRSMGPVRSEHGDMIGCREGLDGIPP